jgi:hypothetical protein
MSDEPEPNTLSGSPPPPGSQPPPASDAPPPGAGASAIRSSFGSSPDRSGVIVGGILIVLGAIFFAERAFGINLGRFGWPLFVVVPGVLMMAASLAVSSREGSGLAVAGAITTVVGSILAFQNATGLWATWAYTWALVGPGGTGVGLIYFGLLKGFPDLVSIGIRSLGASLALFAAFGLFFEGIIGLSGEPFLVGSDLLPFGLIGLGVILLGWAVVGGRGRA